MPALLGQITIAPTIRTTPSSTHNYPDLVDVRGQEKAKRGLLTAAAGGHHLLFFGPPGTGKTMLASRLAGILPTLTEAEAMEVAAIHSLTSTTTHPMWQRPFRTPHHSFCRCLSWWWQHQNLAKFHLLITVFYF